MHEKKISWFPWPSGGRAVYYDSGFDCEGWDGYVLFVLVLVNSYFWVALFYAAVSTGPLAVVYF